MLSFFTPEDALSSWNTTSEDCCKWEGISCDNLTGHVTSLDLQYYYAEGGKLDSSMCELQHLTSLKLSYNRLNGKIPKCIGSLSQLIELKLGGNELVGVIPPTLGNLSKLKTLDLGWNNHLVSNDLEWLSRLSNLRYLDLSSVNLSLAVDWLSSIDKIPTLMELRLQDCGLHHVDPQFIIHSNSSISLKSLYLGGNDLNSSILLSWVLNVSKVLTDLDLSYNLAGPVPPFPRLYSLFLSNNMFSGYVHSFCASSALELTYLDLSSNLLAGPLPDCWEKFQPLQYLNLEKNNLSGKLPDSFGTLRQIQSLHLNNNNFSGEIPSLTLCRNLTLIDVGDNNLEGTLPLWIGYHLHQLIVLRLQANKFQGNIPTSLCDLSFLQVLDLSKNNITGGNTTML